MGTVFCAFLRGVNVNGIAIKMEALRETFLKAGCESVKTVLATGNAVFSHAENVPEETLKPAVEQALSARFSYDAHLVLRTGDEVKRIVEAAREYSLSEETHLYYLFCDDEGLLQALSDEFQALPHDENETLAPYGRGAFWTVRKGDTLNSPFGARALGAARYKEAVTSRNVNTLKKVCAVLP